MNNRKETPQFTERMIEEIRVRQVIQPYQERKLRATRGNTLKGNSYWLNLDGTPFKLTFTLVRYDAPSPEVLNSSYKPMGDVEYTKASVKGREMLLAAPLVPAVDVESSNSKKSVKGIDEYGILIALGGELYRMVRRFNSDVLSAAPIQDQDARSVTLIPSTYDTNGIYAMIIQGRESNVSDINYLISQARQIKTPSDMRQDLPLI